MEGREALALATYAGYRAGAALAEAVPNPLGSKIVALMARTFALAPTRRRRMVRRHFRRVLGSGAPEQAIEAAVTGAFESYARYWHEAFRLPSRPPAELLASCEVEGLEHLDAALDAGRGVVLAVPHLGNWDIGGAWFVARGYPMAAVVEHLEPARLFEWFVANRRAMGIEVVPLGHDATAQCLRLLARPGIVALLCDRDLSGAGLEIEFFGERTRLPAGPAVLALRSQASLVTSACYFTPTGHRIVLRPPLPTERRGRLREDAARLTQQLAVELEELVRAAPRQWHLVQPNWPSDFALLEAMARERRGARR
ncbi:MAG: phosphatidylinositol mannoside acyltransferase [Acidimicrobiia bacterium]